MNKWQNVSILLMTSGLLLGCNHSETTKKTAEQVISATPITTVKAQIIDFPIVEKAVASLESLQSPTLVAEVSGQIQGIYTDVGDKVQKDQTLIKVDDTLEVITLARVKAEVQRLEALVSNQKRTVKRYETLVEKKTQSKSALDNAGAELKALSAQLIEAKQRVREADYRLTKTVIKAPVAGTIQSRQVSLGDTVSPGKPLLQIVTTRKLRALIQLPETSGHYIKTGLPVAIDSPTAPNITVNAKTTSIAPMLSADNRAYTLITDFENPGNFQPGASANVAVTMDIRRNALMLPEKAIVQRPNGSVVYIIKNNHAIETSVRTGHSYQDRIEILSGISADNELALDGAGFLTDGANVKIKG